MRSQKQTRASLIALALTVLVAGCAEEEDVSPTFEDRIPLGLEFDATEKRITWGEEVTLSGVLSQGDELLESEEVVLEADPYPFDRDYADVEDGVTNADGEFEFTAGPDSNTAYRAVAGELSQATSDPIQIRVAPRTKVRTEAVNGGTRFETIFRHPENRSILGSTLFSYAAETSESPSRLRFIGTERVEQERKGRSSASITLPFARNEVVYATCESYTGDSGMSGLRRSCPQTSIPAP